MPKQVALLLVVGLVAGLASLQPRPSTRPTIKGATADHQVINLPALAPAPIRKVESPQPQIDARNVAIMDVQSGSILYEKGGFVAVPIASLTKVMTAIIILEENQLDEVIEISKEATLANGSTILLVPGEKMTVENLLKGLLIQSGNDTAAALAQHNASTVEAFVEKMNSKAAQLGLKSAIFKDPAGLNDEGIASARDMATLMAYALRNERFRQIIQTPETVIYSADGSTSHKLENSNRLVKEEMFFPGIIGGKTGFTPTAGHNLVAAATREGHTLVAVIINTHLNTKEASAIEARKALDWAFTNHVWLDSADFNTD